MINARKSVPVIAGAALVALAASAMPARADDFSIGLSIGGGRHGRGGGISLSYRSHNDSGYYSRGYDPYYDSPRYYRVSSYRTRPVYYDYDRYERPHYRRVAVRRYRDCD